MKTCSDMGSIKIFNDSMSCFFTNGFGDATNTVQIRKNYKQKSIGEFLGHFTVKTEAYLSSYDCSDDAIYTFKPGRYFVYRLKPLHFVITLVDKDIHA